MRKYLIILSLTAFLTPQVALACPQASKSSISVSCTHGVKVYRATPLGAPAIPVQPVVNQASANALAAQQALLAAQGARIDALENKTQQTSPPVRRGRYNRSFGAPIGAFGRGVGSGVGGRINSRLGGNVSFRRAAAFGSRRF